MKKLLSLLFFIPLLIFGQTPQGVGYQGVATDLNGVELINQAISIQASVLSSSATGNVEWQEEHSVTTDAFGLFALTIGQGISTGNGSITNFADISWGSATHFLKIEMDVNGGTNYSHMGTNQMMSVPYALYAENANINYDSIATILSNDSSFASSISGGGSSASMKFPDGIDGDPINFDISDPLNSYTVPTGKTLYILNVYSNSSINKLQINGLTQIDGFNTTGSSSNKTILSNPIIAKSGDVISQLNNNSNSGVQVNFNGYLVDDGYFANSGGGNNNSSSLSDSIYTGYFGFAKIRYSDGTYPINNFDTIAIPYEEGRVLYFNGKNLLNSSGLDSSYVGSTGFNHGSVTLNAGYSNNIFALRITDDSFNIISAIVTGFCDGNSVGRAYYDINQIYSQIGCGQFSLQVIPKNNNTGMIYIFIEQLAEQSPNSSSYNELGDFYYQY